MSTNFTTDKHSVLFFVNRLLLIGLFFLMSLSVNVIWAQGFFVSIDPGSGFPDAGSTGTYSFSICDVDPTNAVFTVDWNVSVSGATNPSVEVTLPPGFDYVDGSLDNLGNALGPTGASESGGIITFSMLDLPSGTSGSFRFRLNMDCSVIAFLTTTQATLTMDAIADEGTNQHITGSFSNTIGIPNMVNNLATNVNVAYTDGVVGEAFTRQFSLLQNGLNRASLEEFEVCVTYEAGLMINSIELVQGATRASVTLSSGCVTINSTNFPTLALPLESNDELIWEESVTPIACDDLGSGVDWSWGCNSSNCQTGFLTMGTALEDNDPSFSLNSITRTINGCMEDGAIIETSWEMSGLAFDLAFDLEARSARTYIDPAYAIQIDTGLGYFNYAGGLTNTATTTACGGTQATIQRTDAFPGPFDARTSSRTIRLRYQIISCCPSGDCNLTNSSILGARPEIRTRDMCGNNRVRDDDVSPVSMGSSTSDLVPAYISDSEVATWYYDLNNITDYSVFGSSGQMCVDFSIDAPLQYQANSISWVDALGTTVYTPSAGTVLTTEVVNVTGSETAVYVCFDIGDILEDGSQISFQASYTCSMGFCGAVANTEMKVGYRFGDETCTEDCIYPILCEDGQTTLGDGCCPGTCDGLSNLSTVVERNCFGLPDSDNDGCEDVGGSIDRNLVALDRAMEGDELSMVAKARVNLVNATDSFNHIFFDLTFPNQHEIGSNQSLTIYDASTMGYYTCDALNVFNTGNTFLRFYLTTDFLRGCGDVPTDFIFQNGDSLILSTTFVNINNPGCLVEQVDIDTEWYATRNGDPDNDPRLSCNLPIPGNYSQVGYSLTLSSVSQGSNGCVGARFRYRATYCIGGGDYGIQPFPY
ncbi:MAG: hypothetical protein AAF985_01865, partial [Bacteroidota bacterium]